MVNIMFATLEPGNYNTISLKQFIADAMNTTHPNVHNVYLKLFIVELDFINNIVKHEKRYRSCHDSITKNL